MKSNRFTAINMTVAVWAMATLLVIGQSLAQAPAPLPRIEVEQLLSDGWEIAGYGALSLEGRSFILFKHRDKHYLVQCSVLYDVTRSKRVATNCYEIR